MSDRITISTKTSFCNLLNLYFVSWASGLNGFHCINYGSLCSYQYDLITSVVDDDSNYNSKTT